MSHEHRRTAHTLGTPMPLRTLDAPQTSASQPPQAWTATQLRSHLAHPLLLQPSNNDCGELTHKDPSSLDLGQDDFEVWALHGVPRVPLGRSLNKCLPFYLWPSFSVLLAWNSGSIYASCKVSYSSGKTQGLRDWLMGTACPSWLPYR